MEPMDRVPVESKSGTRFSSQSMLLLPALSLLVVFFAVPMCWLVQISLTKTSSMPGGPESYGIVQFLRFAYDPYYWKMLGLSLAIGFGATIVTLLISYPVAYYITQCSGWERTIVSAIVLIPIFINLVVSVLGWYILLLPFGLVQQVLSNLGIVSGPLQWLRSFPALLVVLVYEHLPVAVLVLVSSLQSIPRDKIDAARTLGASTFRIVVDLFLPLTMPGLITCVVLIFSLTVSSYLAPVLISGQAVPVLPLEIFTQGTELLNWPFAAALSLVLLVVVVTLTTGFSWVANKLGRRGKWEMV